MTSASKQRFSFRTIRSDFGSSNQLVPNDRRLSEIRTRLDFGIPLYEQPKTKNSILKRRLIQSLDVFRQTRC